jgi:hypothetical protein
MLLQDVIEAYSHNSSQLTVLSFIPYVGGFIVWVYFFLLPIREKKLPIPFWLITMWFAHDTTGAYVFFRLAQQHDGFWFFRSTSIALAVWSVIEIVGMCIVIKHARQDVWGKHHSSPVTVNQAAVSTLAEAIMMICAVNLLRVYMDDESMFKWFSMTNAVFAIGPWYLIKERRSRAGSSVALSIVFVVSVAQTFAPPGIGMFTTASRYFDQPWFYISGVVFTLMAVANLVRLLRFEPKAPVDGRKPIW